MFDLRSRAGSHRATRGCERVWSETQPHPPSTLVPTSGCRHGPDALNTTTSPQLPKYVSHAFGSLDKLWKPGHLRSACAAICCHRFRSKNMTEDIFIAESSAITSSRGSRFLRRPKLQKFLRHKLVASSLKTHSRGRSSGCTNLKG